MRTTVLVIGGGLSGLAAAIRIARFCPEVLLFEQHSRLGGLNSYFYRNKTLYETGLHAITNYAEPADKKAPLNRLLRQLKLKRKDLTFCQQRQSQVIFKNRETLLFSNDFELLKDEIKTKFPHATDKFHRLLEFLERFDPFAVTPFRSAKAFLLDLLQDRLLVDMILCPLMFYGSSHEDDMDLGQFAIMFRAIFLEGMFRPEGTIKDLIELLSAHLENFGGKIITSRKVKKISPYNSTTVVTLESGEEIECDFLVSTIGSQETLSLLGNTSSSSKSNLPRLGFIETIFQAKECGATAAASDTTITFYNDRDEFSYKSPDDFSDISSGVICFPQNFQGLGTSQSPDRQSNSGQVEIRTTHLASYRKWKTISNNRDTYERQKEFCATASLEKLESELGVLAPHIVFQNSFTPVTIERYTSKLEGAIYGNPQKVKNGDIGYNNIFLAGTDQGFLGIVGSMLSGVSIVNQHILPKL